jgi:hypothetical protein
MSGYGRESIDQELHLRDDEHFISKPFSLTLLIETVRKVLEEEHAPAQAT